MSWGEYLIFNSVLAVTSLILILAVERWHRDIAETKTWAFLTMTLAITLAGLTTVGICLS